MNLLQSLRRSGQSVWLDGFERSWVSSSQLQQAIEEDGLRGAQSNFDALNLAIQVHAYDRDFTILAQQGMSRNARSDYDYLIVRDLQLAADLLKQVHSQTQGCNGYVQIALPPDALLAPETAIAAAKDIWQSVGWSNLLLRIPATQLLLPVIEHLIGNRINVNATLVFSPSMYEQVFDSYLRGLKSLIQQGKSVSDVVCFTSVLIGRLDRAIDPLITDTETSFSVMQAKLLYQHYRNLCQSERWRSLPEGVKPLRLVWDCTDIPPESAWRYIQTLVAPETVMMLERSTLEKYREVSLLSVRLTEHEQAEQHVTNGLSERSLDERVDQLVNEEMARSLNAFQQLLVTIEHKRRR
ncbi:transaldolase [Nostoc sp. T09]|uniref:transaldolase family protein n=1 Tax=Nostoc sp. T09 TaxID=1932621 RepID=UPI000A35DD21|nr:transaldolase family protein [Nostoc sp. T09]OUL31550.1 transaldolase [Nostoc sp. T09]